MSPLSKYHFLGALKSLKDSLTHHRMDVKHLSELALIQSMPDLLVGKVHDSRYKSLLTRLSRAARVEMRKMGDLDADHLQVAKGWITEFERRVRWSKKGRHPATIVCFLLAVVDASGKDFGPTIVATLNDLYNYYDALGEARPQNDWAGALACEKWLGIHGVQDTGPSSDARLAEADRRVMFDNYVKAVGYAQP